MIARSFISAAGAIAMSATLGLPAIAQESSDPIKIALFDWTSVNLNAKILGGILEKLGYTVEYPTGEYLSSLTTGLTNGDLTVALEYWDTTAGEAMAASDATGQTERLGALGSHATALTCREYDGGQGREAVPFDHRWRGRDRTCDLLNQNQAFCQLNYPPSGMGSP